MQENEFEKQVKDKMDELRFMPSAPVWEAIKKQIERKKRRLLPFIFLLAAIVIAGSYFVYMDVSEHIKKPGNNISFNNQKKDNFSSHNNTVEEKQTNQPDLKKAHSIFTNTAKKLKQDGGIKSAAGLSLKDNSNLREQKFISAHKEKKKYSQTTEDAILVEQPAEKNYSSTTGSVDFNKTITNADAFLHVHDSIEKNPVVKNSDSIITAIKTNQAPKDKNKPADTLSSLLKKNKQLNKPLSSKWNWGITAMAGKSNIVNSFKFSNINSAKAYNSNDSASNNAAAYKKPYWPASAYNFGIAVQRRIFKNSFINFGLQYSHLSTKSYTGVGLNNYLIPVAVGLANITSPDNYYVPGTKKTYTNKYNFIELPVSLQSSLLHVNRFSLLYDAGVSVMQRIHGNSLLYNAGNNTYFNDSGMLLRRTQFQVLTGIDFKLHLKNKGSFSVGPHVEYSLSGFLKNNNFDKLHYVHFDIKASWLFDKH